MANPLEITRNKRIWLLLLLVCLIGLIAFFYIYQYQDWDIAMIPLDSRPVNTDLPQTLGTIGGFQVILPDEDLLDQFLTPSKPEPLLDWLYSTGTEADLLIIHLNELIYGSLLNSREVGQYLDSHEKLAKVETFLNNQRNSKQNIQLIYILPRLLVSQYDLTMWAYEKELSSYSQLKHQQKIKPDNEEINKALSQLEETIPQEILGRYNSLYVEAYLTGLKLLSWLEEGLVNEVIIGLDDAAPYGLNVQAFHRLKTEAEKQMLDHAFFLHGADELAPLAIARHSLNLQDPEAFSCLYLTPEDANKIFPYEAISLQENIEEKIAYLYAPKNFETKLKKRPVLNAKKTLILNTNQAMSKEAMDQAWTDIGSLTTYTGLVDVAKTNGAFTPFIDQVGLEKVYDYVDSYAGWNTAGNSLGTVIAHLLFYEQGQNLPFWLQGKAFKAHEKLQIIRLLDDYIFQSKVRSEFTSWSLANGFHYLSFGNHWSKANDQLQKMMLEAIKPYPSLSIISDQGKTPTFTFPWPRSFEIKIQ